MLLLLLLLLSGGMVCAWRGAACFRPVREEDHTDAGCLCAVPRADAALRDRLERFGKLSDGLGKLVEKAVEEELRSFAVRE